MSIIFIIVKYLAFIALSGVSMVLSYNMFSQLSQVPIEAVLLSVVAIAIESLKIFSLVRGNTLYQVNLKTQALRSWSMYTVLAILAVLASYGFTLTVVNRGIEAAEQSPIQFEIEANRDEVELIEEQLSNLDRQIEAAVERQEDTPYDFVTAWTNITEQVNQLEEQRGELVQRQMALNQEYGELRTELARARVETRSTANMFRLMAESFGIPETVLMLALLLTIAILIELGIVSTSPSIPIDKKHMGQILDEFAHNLHLDEFEAEQDLEKAKRKQAVRAMYDEAGIPYPGKEQRTVTKSQSEPDDDDDEFEPNENLRKLVKDPLDPSLPDDTHAAAFTPEQSNAEDEQDISFFNAVKTVLFRKSHQAEDTDAPREEDDTSVSEEIPHTEVAASTTEAEDAKPEIPIRQLSTHKEETRAPEPAALEEKKTPEPQPESKEKVESVATPPQDKQEENAEIASSASTEPEKDDTPSNWSSNATNIESHPVDTDRKSATQMETSGTENEVHVRPQPKEVGETKTYRFGKTTPEVRKLFIAFVEALFSENEKDFLQDPAVASRKVHIKPALGNVFINRLCDLKGKTGAPLIEHRDDGFYQANYTKEYIISYATKEVNTQKGDA